MVPHTFHPSIQEVEAGWLISELEASLIYRASSCLWDSQGYREKQSPPQKKRKKKEESFSQASLELVFYLIPDVVKLTTKVSHHKKG